MTILPLNLPTAEEDICKHMPLATAHTHHNGHWSPELHNIHLHCKDSTNSLNFMYA